MAFWNIPSIGSWCKINTRLQARFDSLPEEREGPSAPFLLGNRVCSGTSLESSSASIIVGIQSHHNLLEPFCIGSL